MFAFVRPRRDRVVGGTAGVERRLQRLSTCSWKLFNDGKEDADTEDGGGGGTFKKFRQVFPLKRLTLFLETKRLPEKCRQKGNARNSSSQQENEGESGGEMPYVGHLSPEKRGSVGGGVEEEQKEG